MQYSNTQKKEMERLAVNAPNLKDYGSKGLDKNGNVKQGYYRLFDNRVIKKSDLHPTQAKENEELVELRKLAINFPNLHNCKNLGSDASGNAKRGFLKLEDGKIVSINKLKEAKALVDKDVVDPETVK